MNLDVEYAEYRSYIEEFAKTIDPHDQLPLRVSGYCLRKYEVHGEILDWLITYLGRACPTTLRIYLIQTALKTILEKVRDSPDECGYDANRDVYQPLKLVRVVVAVVNCLIFDLQDNAKLYEVPLPPTSPHASDLTKLKQPPKVSVDAIKNTRRTMEDRHVIIEDFNGYFNIQDSEPTYYYGIFDGHSGSDAATYANSHLNFNISVHPSYPSDIKQAMSAAFLVTDIEFLKKAKAENLNSGTTALCAIYRKLQKKLFVGWCGDSQALIARLGNVHQIVKKHSPEDASERKRIEDLGGVVLYWSNSYRVNGSLAVSRAIGDALHKPFVSAEPDIAVLELDGEEDFFVMGCDGLWDSLTEDDVALTVYKRLRENPNNYRTIASELCALAKTQGSRDNISVIVVYLKEPELIATQSWPSEITQSKDAMENLNMYESEQVAPPQPAVVSMDALGNTNQDIFSNPFGDYTNQLISDVPMGKSTEITDMVMQQQPENEFCNLTDTLTSNLNTINNNKIINGSHQIDESIVGALEVELQPPQQQPASDSNVLILNDDNNNSNDNFNNPENLGPETDVDAIEEDEDFQYHAGGEATGGEKEKTQMEFKETDDVTDHIPMSFGGETMIAESNTLLGNALESKIFEELSLHNPDLMMSGGDDGGNPFAAGNEFADDSAEIITDNKLIEEQIDEMQQQQAIEHGGANDFIESAEHEIDLVAHELESPAAGNAFELEQELISANEINEEVAIEQPQQPLMTDLGIAGAAQGIEESEGSDDEWNYIKVEDKKEVSSVTAEPTSVLDIEKDIEEQSIVEPSVVASNVDEQPQQQQEEEFNKIDSIKEETEEESHVVSDELNENLIEADNKFIEENQQQPEIHQDFVVEEPEPVNIIEEEEIYQQQEQVACDLIESPNIEGDKDFEQEKEPVAIEEERHVQDEIEKDLHLEVETEEADDMDSQLNPDAKEFVPTSPVRNEFQSPPPQTLENGMSPFVNPILSNFSDTVVSQSPRKGDALIMEDVPIPEENDFDKEANERPHEVNLMEENFQRIESPNQLNLKEAMQVDDKLEQEYKDDTQEVAFEEEKLQVGEQYKELESSFSDYSNGFKNTLDDAMNRSFYEGRDSDILADPAKNILNTPQPLPDDEEPEADRVVIEKESDNPEVDLMGSGEPVEALIAPSSQMDSSDNFEVEKFVEEIKGVEENKYVDTGLSPTIPEFVPNQIQTVEEVIIAAHSPMKEVADDLPETFITQTSSAAIIEVASPPSNDEQTIEQAQFTEIKENIPEEMPIEPQSAEVQSTAVEEVIEASAEQQKEYVQEEVKVEEPKTEEIAEVTAIAGAVAAVTAAAAVAASSDAAKKKSAAATASKPDAKKATDTKAKVQPKTTDTKKVTEVKKTLAPKTSAAPSKPAVSKTSTTKATVPSTTAAARPKPASTVPAAKKATSLTSKPQTYTSAPKTTDTRPTPASRTITATAPKPRTITSAPATKSAPPKSTTEVKSKVAIERKPLASSAPATRAPAKPTTLAAAKPKVNGTTSTSARPTTTSARLNSSAIDKLATSPLKEKVLNKSASLATRSPRPTTSSVTASKTTLKTDLKSPSSATKSTGLSAVGTKKPLTIVKKSPSAEKTGAAKPSTITKKPATAGSVTKTTVVAKKTTTTTTVVKKKVVNGDIVMEETNTVTKTADDETPALNGHVNGNGIAENGNGVVEHVEASLI